MLLVESAPSSSLGSFSAGLIPKAAFWIATASIWLCYIIAVHLGQEPPFPHCWISGTAGHYPTYIIFRLGTISGSTLLILSWLINHFWVRQVSELANFKVLRFLPQIGLIFGIMGALGLMGSTANIDTGTHNSRWHTTCASIFFIGAGLSSTYNTFVATAMCYYGVISKKDYLPKLILTVLLFIQVYISNHHGTTYGTFATGPLGNDIDHILEYTAAFTILFYIYIIGMDVRKYNLVYEWK